MLLEAAYNHTIEYNWEHSRVLYQRAALDDGEDGAEDSWADEQLFLLPQMQMDVM